MPDAEPPNPTPTTDPARMLELRQQLDNVVEGLCGYVIGKFVFLYLMLFSIGREAVGLYLAENWRFALEGAVAVLFSILFVRGPLRWIALAMWRRDPPPAKPKRNRKTAVYVFSAISGVLLILVGIAAAVRPDRAALLARVAVPVFVGAWGLAIGWYAWRSRSGTEVRCARCDYPHGPSPAPVCPECGAEWLKPGKSLIGHRSRQRSLVRWAIGAIALASAVLLVNILFPLVRR